MSTPSRIPELDEATFDGALMWFSQMHCGNLLFHPEDDPADIIRISSGERLFSAGKVSELRSVLEKLEDEIGLEQVIEAAYPIFMNACGIRLDA